MPTKKGEKIESLADLKNAVAISEATKNEMLNKGIEALQKCFSANKTIGGVVLAEKRTPGGKGDVKYYSVAATLILGFTEKASLKSFKLQELCKGIPAPFPFLCFSLFFIWRASHDSRLSAKFIAFASGVAQLAS